MTTDTRNASDMTSDEQDFVATEVAIHIIATLAREMTEDPDYYQEIRSTRTLEHLAGLSAYFSSALDDLEIEWDDAEQIAEICNSAEAIVDRWLKRGQR